MEEREVTVAVEGVDMENGDQLVGMEVVEEIEMGSGNLVESIEVVEMGIVENLTNQPNRGERPVIQGGVHRGDKDGVAEYINQDTPHQNVSSESAILLCMFFVIFICLIVLHLLHFSG